MAFQKATKQKIKLRLALVGPSSSGKTYSALAIATKLGKKVAVIDSEGKRDSKDPSAVRSSAALYSDKFDFDFDVLKTYHPNNYIAAIKEAEEAGYDVIVIDSLTHAWNANEGALDLVSKEQLRNKSANQFTAWRHVTPLVNALVDAIISSRCHVIVTMRAKEKTVMEQDERGKTVIKKVGMEAVMREGLNYEFDIVLDLDINHNGIVTKTRLDLLDNEVINKPGADLANTLLDWLDAGEDAPQPKKAVAPKKAVPASKAKTSDPEKQETETNEVHSGDDGGEETPTRNPDVEAFIDTVEKYLAGKATEGNEDEVVAAAREISGVQYQIENIRDLPVEQLDDLKTFMRGPLLDSLRTDGLLKGK